MRGWASTRIKHEPHTAALSESHRSVCLRAGTWSFSDMFSYVPLNSLTPRRGESKHFSRKDIHIEMQQLEMGKVPWEGWGK